MKLQKYLAILSYNGKSFSGSQIQNVKDQRISTVQKSLQEMISQLFPDYATPNSIRLASRTDAKVGAHRSSCDFFLQYPSQIPIFPPSIIQKSLNLNFAKRNIDIYIPNVCLVNNEFNSMKDAKLRKYVYKIKTGKNLSSYIFDKSEYLVIEKSNYAKWDIDYNKINEIIPIFTSKHYDFRNFCVTKGIDERKINSIECFVEKDYLYDSYNIYLVFTAKGYLRSQIRIIVNCILEYCTGMVSLEHIEKLLERKIEMVDKDKAPAEGLALLDIIYDDSVFLYNDKMEKSVESEYIYYRQSLKNNSK